MKTMLKRSALLIAMHLAALAAYGEVTITLVGEGAGYDATGAEVTGFRSTSIEKTFDGDSDNAYGTTGYIFFGNGSSGNVAGQPFALHKSGVCDFITGFAPGSNFNSVAKFDTYTKIDDPTRAIAPVVADWSSSGVMSATTTNLSLLAGAWLEMLTFTIDASAPTSFRVGIMPATEHTADGRWDPTGLRLSLEGGMAIAVTNLANTTEGMVFFDISVSDATAGTFSIEGQKRADESGPTIAGVTFDGGGTYIPPVSTILAGYDFTGGSASVSTNNSKIIAGDWSTRFTDAFNGGEGDRTGKDAEGNSVFSVDGGSMITSIGAGVTKSNNSLQTAINNADYFSVTITPKEGFKMNLASFTFMAVIANANRSAKLWAVTSNIGGHTVAAALGTGSISGLDRSAYSDKIIVDLSEPQFQNIATATEFRIYAYGAGSVASVSLTSYDNIALNGTVSLQGTVILVQ